MKACMILTLTAAIALFVSAQKQADSPQISIEGSPDVPILGNFYWKQDTPGSAIFAIRIKNNGKKTVRGISWEHVVTIPSGKNKVNITLELKSDELYLRSDEVQDVLSVINKVLDSSVATTSPQRIRLTKVEYEDGTSWQRPDNENK